MDIAKWLLDFLPHYGYPGLFLLLMLEIVGLPIPGELVMTCAGFLAHAGKLSFGPTVVAAFLGSWCGITLSYVIGRTLGVAVINRLAHVSPQKVERFHAWFARYGKWTLVVGYYLPGIRHLVGIAAGGAKLSPHVFALFAYTGGAIWAFVFVTFGYMVGDQWEKLSGEVHQVLLVCSLAAVVVGAAYLLIVRMRRGRWAAH